MRLSFWPERARKALLVRAWPWVLPSDGSSFAQRVRLALDSHWTSRLERVPEDFLSPTTRERILQARASIVAESFAGGGFEKVEQAVNGLASAFWFFDLGCAAWIMTLARLREEGWIEEDPTFSFHAIEEAWRKSPAEALKQLDAVLQDRPTTHPTLCLFRAPLALWEGRDFGKAMADLDRALSGMSSFALEAIGVTLPLTYAFLHALQGNVEQATLMLAEGRFDHRPAGWAGLNEAEARYQRARFLWDLGAFDESRKLLSDVLGTDAAYMLRLYSDPAWRDGPEQEYASLAHVVGDVAGRAQSHIARWQQARKEDDLEQSKQILDVLRFGGQQPYFVVAVGARLAMIRAMEEDQEAVDRTFWQDLDLVRAFAEQLPDNMPLRLGPGYRRRFLGEKSDLEALENFVATRRWGEAKSLLGRMVADLPWAVQMASIAYLARLANALVTAAEVLRTREREEDLARLQRVFELIERCQGLVEPIQKFSDRLGEGLSHALQKIWRDIGEIEGAWVESERRQFGRMRLSPPNVVQPVQRGGWTSYQLVVTDAAGQPVAGVPVLWRVVSGPAFPKEPADCLDGEWALSLHTGTVHLTVEAMGVGDEGLIEAQILGNYSPVEIAYRVVDREDT